MRDIFTVEETNLMYIYDNGDRKALIDDLVADLHEIDDTEMIAIFVNTIEKLESITNEAFDSIGLYAADDYKDGEV
jgi:hypothetical protein